MSPVGAIDSRHMRGNFSSHADIYDRYASVQRRVVELLGRRVPQFTAKTGLVLDIGTGTGALAAVLLESHPERQLVVLDIAHGMTRETAARLPAVSACDGDARQLPFVDDCFAGIVSSSVYQWVDSLPGAFAEVARVLRPGGFFAVALFGEQTLRELRAAHHHAVNRSTQGRTSHTQSFPSLGEVAEAFAAVGLACRELFSTMEVEFHPDVPDLLRQLKQIGASNAAVDRPRGLASRRVMQVMMKYYETTYRCAAGLPASYEVIVALAEKTPG